MRIQVIVNPRAGRGRGRRAIPVIKEKFKDAGVDFDIHVTRFAGDAVETARRAAAGNCDVVVAAGGDGTANEVVNGIVDTGARFGVIPCGTGNDFAIGLGIPRNIARACDLILNGTSNGEVRRVDIGKVAGRYFIGSVGIGFDATVALEANRSIPLLRGPVVYAIALLKVLSTYRTRKMRIALDGNTIHVTPLLVAVTNAPTYGGGMRISPNAIMDDGLFDICVIGQMRSMEALYHFPKVFKGSHARLEKVTMLRGQDVTVDAEEAVPFHMDGEVMTGKHLHLEIFPSALGVICPA
ncbi:MAG: diacylglycerol kinase family lipid kinase [Firmicutes bacterium]|nr:diacylglycerol kinase family lipid kinase [Bacillota bacterium]